MALMQVIGIASVFPFMQMVSDPSIISENSFLSEVYENFGFENTRSMLIASGIFVIILLGLANLATVYISWIQQKFVWNILHQVSTRLLQKYLHQPYKYFLQNNSSRLLTNINSETSLFAAGVMLPSIQFLSRLMMAITISALLIIANPKITFLMFFVLTLSYTLIYYSRRNLLKRLGNERVKSNRKRFKSADESLKGIKTLMTYGKRSFFYDRFEQASKKNSTIPPVVNIIGIIPKYIIEIVAFAGIIGILLFKLVNGENVQSVIPLLSLYAIAAYRLLPAFQEIFATSTKIRHNFPVVDLLYNDLKEDSATSASPSDLADSIERFKEQITLTNLGFYYDDANVATLSNVNITIKKGQTVAFVGSTGSGKTTLTDIIVGLLAPQSGSISIDGKQLKTSNTDLWQKQLGYVPQEVFLYDETVMRNIAFGVKDEEIDFQKIQTISEMVNMHNFITSDLPNQYNTFIGENGVRLSGGQRQRLGLARALYRDPSVLVLDEATSALDGITESIIIESLKELSTDLTVIIIAHRLSTVKHADTIYLLANGKVADEGTYSELVSNNPEFRKMAELS